METQSPSHTWKVFEPDQFRPIVERFADFIRVRPEIKAVAACGNSGVPLAGALSYLLGIGMIVVRKREERRHEDHGGLHVTGYAGDGQYLMVDDCIATGATVYHVISSIAHGNGAPDRPFRSTPYGVALYGRYCGDYPFVQTPGGTYPLYWPANLVPDVTQLTRTQI